MRGVLRRVPRVLTRYAGHTTMLWRAAPLLSTISLLGTVIGAAVAILTMIATGRLIGSLAAGDTGSMWVWFAAFAGATIAGQLVQALTALTNPRIWARYRARVNDLVAEAGLSSRGLAPLDSGLGRDLRLVTENSRHWLFTFGMTGTWGLLQTRLVAVGSIAMLLAWRWWVPVLVAVTFMVAAKLYAIWVDNILDSLWSKPHIGRQQADYVAKVMTAPETAKEVRLFGLAGWLLQRYVDLWESASRPFWRDSDRRLLPFLGALVPMLAAMAGSLGVLAHDALDGRVHAESVTTYLLALLALAAFGPGGDQQQGIIRVAGVLRDLGALRARLGLPPLEPATGTEITADVLPPESPESPESPRSPGGNSGGSRICFDDVVFTYPTRDEPTLRQLDLEIPEGQSVAVVGVNGAGKSTLIKLLSGLYAVDSGAVTIGGRDAYDDPTLRGTVAVIFQDFVRYPFSLRDNVGFGAVEYRADTELLEQAMIDAGGADVLDRLDHDWERVLSPQYAGGTDLSGGQWQRVALARALAAIAGGARILVLDEPTAALDVRAEAALFDRFLDVTRGVTTILVSHRLSTVRHAERIVVLDGATGRITEDGTHDELMTLAGEYATMFTLQATRFARAGSVDEA